VRIVVLRAPTVAGRADRARRSRAQTAADPLDAAQTQGYGHWALEVDDLDEAFALLSAAPVRALVVSAPRSKPEQRPRRSGRRRGSERCFVKGR
jgi:hypothetical protein